MQVFISAVSKEFKEARSKIATLLEEHGAHVEVQRDHPTDLSGAAGIKNVIDNSDLVICLIGHRYGYLKPHEKKGAASKGCSWTQWEYLYARRMPRKRGDSIQTPLVFFDKSATPLLDQSPPQTKNQIRFRDSIYGQEKTSPDSIFFHPYEGPEKLEASINRMLEDFRGPLAQIRQSYWARIKNSYRRKTVVAWNENFPEVCDPGPPPGPGPKEADRFKERNGQLKIKFGDAERPPFIERQGFTILKPAKEKQCAFLHCDAFVPGRESEFETKARNGAEWHPLSYGSDDPERTDRERLLTVLRQPAGADIVLGGVNIPQRIRLYLVSGGGVGKSVNMAWLQASLNGLGGEVDPGSKLGILLAAGDLQVRNRAGYIDTLIANIIRHVPVDGHVKVKWHESTIRLGLRDDLDRSLVVVLIDSMDHVAAERESFLLDLQSDSPAWGSCPVVAAGRPHALIYWQDAPSNRALTVAACLWRFLQPAEFSSEEAAIYLGRSDDKFRFDVVREHLGDLLKVPRILEYVRKLHGTELVGIRTRADVYARAVRALVKENLRQGPPTARAFGLNPSLPNGVELPENELVRYIIRFLSVMAFMSICKTFDPSEPLPSDAHEMRLDKDDMGDLLDRLKPHMDTEVTLKQIRSDFLALGAFSAVAANGLLEEQSMASDDVRISWANRSVQQFLAAYWLAYYAGGLEAQLASFESGGCERKPEPSHDTLRFRNYVYFPEADLPTAFPSGPDMPMLQRTDDTYDLNIFLAEMPVEAINRDSWVAAASAWYDPDLFGGRAAPDRVWSTEMLYRSWRCMHVCANRPVDDWWDVPYNHLAAQKPGTLRHQISLHPEIYLKPKPGLASQLARKSLDRFTGEFAQMVKDKQTPALEMIEEQQWINVPAGSFQMGQPKGGAQGCLVSKSDAYWHRLLDRVQTGGSAKTAAEEATPTDWFTGARGGGARQSDIDWLADLFASLEEEKRTSPDRKSDAYILALERIKRRFYTKDETPLEESGQDISPFTMHRLPVLHRWYFLFGGGHRHAVDACLKGIIQPRRLQEPPELPPDDHPAIYISWYDAWAFCQWANWHDPHTQVQYGLRLPHEPEWEYAARWQTREDGHAAKTPQSFRWWWGNDFYQHEDSPEEEDISVPRAHADGRPGKTRAPAIAAPNGLGFHDILGNVWEWTANLYDLRKEAETKDADDHTLRYSRFDPKLQPPVNGQRTMRGGLWYYLNILATCSNRFRYVCNDRDYKMGFRVVREVRTGDLK